MKIIGIVGGKKSGKDTAADSLCTEYGYTKVAVADPMKRLFCQLFSFTAEQMWGPSEFREILDSRTHDKAYWKGIKKKAMPTLRGWLAMDMKVNMGQVDPWSDKLYQSWVAQILDKPATPRDLLQSFGTSAKANLSTSIWDDRLGKTIDALKEGYQYTPVEGLYWFEDEPVPGVVVSDLRFRSEVKAVKSRGGKVMLVIGHEQHDGHKTEVAWKSIELEVFDSVLYNRGTLEDFLENVHIVAKSLRG